MNGVVLMTTHQTLQRGDKVVCTESKPFDAIGDRLNGIILHVFRNGWVLADVGTPGRGRFNHDARVFDAEMVKRA